MDGWNYPTSFHFLLKVIIYTYKINIYSQYDVVSSGNTVKMFVVTQKKTYAH